MVYDYRGNDQHDVVVQVGVVFGKASNGNDPCDSDYPGVYARLEEKSVLDWIKDTILGDGICHK